MNLRTSIFTVMAVIATLAAAEVDPVVDEDGEPIDPEEIVEKLSCADKATTPDDRCYFKSDIYQDKGRYEKLSELWNKLVPDEEHDDPPHPFYWADQPNFFLQASNGSFCQRSDENQRKRLKTTHTQGLVAQVEWVVFDNDQNYTGVYATGTDTAVIRLSESANLHE